MKPMPLPRRALPLMARVKQKFSADRIEDVRRATREKILAADLPKKIFPGAQVAITAGSRGLGGFCEILPGIIDALKSLGAKPFIIPAMSREIYFEPRINTDAHGFRKNLSVFIWVHP